MIEEEDYKPYYNTDTNNTETKSNQTSAIITQKASVKTKSKNRNFDVFFKYETKDHTTQPNFVTFNKNTTISKSTTNKNFDIFFTSSNPTSNNDELELLQSFCFYCEDIYLTLISNNKQLKSPQKCIYCSNVLTQQTLELISRLVATNKIN